MANSDDIDYKKLANYLRAKGYLASESESESDEEVDKKGAEKSNRTSLETRAHNDDQDKKIRKLDKEIHFLEEKLKYEKSLNDHLNKKHSSLIDDFELSLTKL